MGVPSDIGQRLADAASRCSALVRDAVSTGPSKETRTSKPTTGWSSSDEGEDVRRAPPDRPPHPSSKMVDRTWRMVSSMSEMAALSRSALRAPPVAGHALEGQPDGEEALDHRVVEIPGQAVPLLVDGHLAGPAR